MHFLGTNFSRKSKLCVLFIGRKLSFLREVVIGQVMVIGNNVIALYIHNSVNGQLFLWSCT